MSWAGAFFAFVSFIVLIAFITSLAERDYIAAASLGALGLMLPILRRAAS